MPLISQLFIYPIKSLGGIELDAALITERGFQYDRRWMLIDEHNRFISQREWPLLALLQVELKSNGLLITHKQNSNQYLLPFNTITDQQITVQVWEDSCNAMLVSREADAWFSQQLHISCRLVYMPDNTMRKVDARYAHHNEITAFSDGYPFLLIGQSSLDDLNKRLETPVPINRFRPNIVVSESEPYEEDEWAHFTVGNTTFFGVKLCARCVLTTINQDDGIQGKEPLRTLSTYRVKDHAVMFGQNLLHAGNGKISVGDQVIILKRQILQRY